MCAALLATGCGGDVEGAPVADELAEAWDPCSIPADAIAATGLNPVSTNSGWGEGIVVTDWTRCMWSGPAASPWYFFSIRYSATYSVADAGIDPNYTDFQRAEMGERTALRYVSANSEDQAECNFALPTLSGTSKISVNVMSGLKPERNPCETLTTHASDLIDFLPRPSN